MGIVSLAPAGITGIIEDIPPAELVPSAWSSGLNMRFAEGAVMPILDDLVIETGLSWQPTWAIPTMQTSASLSSWLVASEEKIYAYISNTLTEITRVVGGDYTTVGAERWSGCVLSGVTVLHNGVDEPQAWLAPDSGTEVVALANWPASTTCRTLRGFKSHLIALDVKKSGTRYPTMVKWSHPADAGTVPVTWDETDPSYDAGEWVLSETPGYCVDCITLRDINVVYKTDSVWGMQYIGGTFIFRFFKMFDTFGIPQRDCAIEYQPGRHLVFTGDDLITHDGQMATSIVTNKMRKRLKALTADQTAKAFLTLASGVDEVWLCYPGSTLTSDVTMAIVYNWREGTLSPRELAPCTYMTIGGIDPSAIPTWNASTETWDTSVDIWGGVIIRATVPKLLGLQMEKLALIDVGPRCTAANTLERTYLGIPVRADKAPDLSSEKLLLRIWPRITGSTGDVLYFTLGGADSVAESIEWEDAQQFIIGMDSWIEGPITSKVFALRITASVTNPWKLSGFDAEIQPNGVN